SAQALEAPVGVGGVEPRASFGACGRCLDQGFDLVVTETSAALACHIAAHHAFAQARLERLIDHAAIFKILDASLEKILECHFLRCVLWGVKHAPHRPVAWTGQRPDLPTPVTAIAAIALNHALACGGP